MRKITRLLSAFLLTVMIFSTAAPCVTALASGIVSLNPTLNKAEPTYTRKYSFNDTAKDELNDAMLNNKENYNGTKSFKEIYDIFKNEIKNNTNGYSFGTPTKNLASVSDAPWHDKNWNEKLPTITKDHPRLLITRDNIPTVRNALEERNPTNERFFALLDMNVALPREYDSNGKPVDTVKNGVAFGGINSGKLKAAESSFDGRPGTHNYDKYYLEVIQVKALGYLIDGHELYGYQAIHCMKQMLRTLDINITGNQEREYGNVMFTAALVYDWCYDLLDADDKNQLIAGVEYKVGKISNSSGNSFSVGFPPTKDSGSVTGHGAERQVLRDMLAASIAFFGDNDSWWNYIGTLVYEKYVPVRNYYFRSGISQQGVGTYVSGRHIADMFSAWLLMTSTGSQPYENIDKTVRNFLGYEITPGKIYTDGDGSGVTQSNTEFRALAYMTAYMFEDEAMLAQARDMLPNQAFGAGGMIDLTIEMHSALYVALTGMSDITPGDDKYAGMPLIQYNGSPVGQYVTHEAFGVTDSASVFMKIKERMTANHEHADAGNFMIYYKGMLTADGGVYKGYSSDHTRFYHQATVGHNSILVVNPNTSALTESESNIANIARSTKWYSGGQMWPAEASDLEDFKTDTYKAGDVIGNRHGYYDEAQTQPKYAYLNGNLVYSYPSDTVDSLGRRMLTVYTGDEDVPMLFFVYDTIGAKAQSYTKKFLLQIPSSNAPTINTTNKTVTTVNGDGKLVLTCMSPDTSIQGIGGRVYKADGSIDLVNSKNYLINGSQNYPTGTTFDTGSWGRVEITATNASKSSKILNAMYVTDATNTNTYSMKSITNVSSLQSSAGDFEGAVFEGKIAAVFAKKDVTGARTGTVSYMNKGAHTFTTEGEGTMSYYVDGMDSGNWNVTVNGERIGTVKAGYGLLTFDAPAGKVVLEKEAADVTALKNELLTALGAKISNTNGEYTAASYAAYVAEYDAIVASINNATDIAALNAINVESVKANAEANLINGIEVKKAELKNSLGAKIENTNDKYTASSYSQYSLAYDAILTSINNATTIDALNGINITALKASAEAKLNVAVFEKDNITTENGSASKDVDLSYEGTSQSEPVYSIDVIWTDLTFTYTEGTAQWDPSNHDYSSTVEDPKWTDSTGEITVTNHSNAQIFVEITFEKALTPNGTAALEISNNSFTLANAENTTVSDAPSLKSKITAAGIPTKNGYIGKLTVKISKVN